MEPVLHNVGLYTPLLHYETGRLETSVESLKCLGCLWLTCWPYGWGTRARRLLWRESP